MNTDPGNGKHSLFIFLSMWKLLWSNASKYNNIYILQDIIISLFLRFDVHFFSFFNLKKCLQAQTLLILSIHLNFLTKSEIFDLQKLKAFADNKHALNGRNCPSWGRLKSESCCKGLTKKLLATSKFLLFPQCFLLNQIIVSSFVHISDIIIIICC